MPPLIGIHFFIKHGGVITCMVQVQTFVSYMEMLQLVIMSNTICLDLSRTRSRNNGCYYEPTPLLFPTGAKDFHTHPYIRGSWDMLRAWLHSDSTWRVTIFGYSAPVSDKAAIDLMKSAWGTPDKRNMEQF